MISANSDLVNTANGISANNVYMLAIGANRDISANSESFIFVLLTLFCY